MAKGIYLFMFKNRDILTVLSKVNVDIPNFLEQNIDIKISI